MQSNGCQQLLFFSKMKILCWISHINPAKNQLFSCQLNLGVGKGYANSNSSFHVNFELQSYRKKWNPHAEKPHKQLATTFDIGTKNLSIDKTSRK